MSSFCLEILKRYSELATLGTFSMPSYGQQKRWYLLQGNFDAYLHAKNKFISHLFLAKI